MNLNFNFAGVSINFLPVKILIEDVTITQAITSSNCSIFDLNIQEYNENNPFIIKNISIANSMIYESFILNLVISDKFKGL